MREVGQPLPSPKGETRAKYRGRLDWHCNRCIPIVAFQQPAPSVPKPTVYPHFLTVSALAETVMSHAGGGVGGGENLYHID